MPKSKEPMNAPETPAPRRGRGGTPGNKGGGRKPADPETFYKRYSGFRLPPEVAAEVEKARMPGEDCAKFVKRMFELGFQVWLAADKSRA